MRHFPGRDDCDPQQGRPRRRPARSARPPKPLEGRRGGPFLQPDADRGLHADASLPRIKDFLAFLRRHFKVLEGVRVADLWPGGRPAGGSPLHLRVVEHPSPDDRDADRQVASHADRAVRHRRQLDIQQ
ncbi:UNVERIFIED_CONTAM: hypothetical protein GTU68_049009 [Idotea baltica]|nr:hypothetical protein [Idotea baltica]